MSKILCIVVVAALLASFANGNAEPNCALPSRCVPQWFCENGKVNKYGEGLINLRSRTEYECSNYLYVCCNPENFQTPAAMPAPQNVCGSRNIKGKVIQITDETYGDTHFAEFPWVVAIFEKTDKEIKLLGGGSILAPKVVLTAAHIVSKHENENLIARAGEWDTQTESEPYNHIDRFVIEKIIHEGFDIATARYDIALLVLDISLTLSHHIMPLCMPRARELFKVRKCYVAGWGKESFDSADFTNILQKVDLPIVNVQECQEKLRKTILGKHYVLHDSLMCAGGEFEKDACTGDGGGPLFCSFTDMPNRYYQIGIVAFGLSCGTKNVPGVYTNVHAMRDWIIEKLLERRINPDFYTPPKTIAYNTFNFENAN